MPARFHFEAVRDIVGILRAMYAEERSKSNPSPVRLRKIERVAKEFLDALAIAEQHDPGTTPHERAVARAEGAVLRLGDLISILDPIEPVLRVAGKRIIGERPGPSARAEKWAAGRMRR